MVAIPSSILKTLLQCGLTTPLIKRWGLCPSLSGQVVTFSTHIAWWKGCSDFWGSFSWEFSWDSCSRGDEGKKSDCLETTRLERSHVGTGVKPQQGSNWQHWLTAMWVSQQGHPGKESPPVSAVQPTSDHSCLQDPKQELSSWLPPRFLTHKTVSKIEWLFRNKNV